MTLFGGRIGRERAQREGEGVGITARDKRGSNSLQGVQRAEVEMTKGADATNPTEGAVTLALVGKAKSTAHLS